MLNNETTVAVTVTRRYNPLSKISCMKAAVHLLNEEGEIEYLAELPEESFIADTLLTSEAKAQIRELKDKFYKDKEIRFFDVMLDENNSVAASFVDEALDVVTLDPNVREGFSFWSDLLSSPKKMEGTPPGMEAFKYDLVDNLLFIGQIVTTVKALYNITDTIRPTFDSKVTEFWRAVEDDIYAEEYIDDVNDTTESQEETNEPAE